MSRPSHSLANELIGHLRNIEKTRAKMETLFSSGAIVRRDIEQVYAGLYMNAITSLEHVIENLFIGLLVGSLTARTTAIVPRVTFRSNSVARDVVFGGQNYVDWFPYDRTVKRAKAFFRAGMPFTSLTSSDKHILERLLYIRNAIAHPSSHAKHMFEEKVIGTLPLTTREKTPMGFLRSPFRIAPYQTRYETVISEMVYIANILCR